MTAVMEKTNLVVPMGFVEIDSEEMTYVEGGINVWGRLAISAAIVVAGVGLVVALATMQFYVAAFIMGKAFKGFMVTHGKAAVIAFVTNATGISYASVRSALDIVWRNH